MQSNCPSLSPNAIYRLTMPYMWLGVGQPRVGVVRVNTRSLLLCFYSKPSFAVHDGKVILNPGFVDF